MSDHYPRYPGEDPGPVAPPPSHGAQGQYPQSQHPQGQYAPSPHWRPPTPPQPSRPSEESTRRPGTVTAAVWTMIAGALVTIASTAVGVWLVDHLTALVERDLASDPTIDAAFVEGFTSVFETGMVVFFVLAAVVTVPVWLWMAWKNGQGRAWARITATCLGALGVAGMVSSGAMSAVDYAAGELPLPSTGLLVALGLVGAASVLVSALAVLLLWLKPSNTYFTAVAAQRRWEQWSRLYGPTHAGQ